MNILEHMKSELEDIWTNADLTIEQGTAVIIAYTKLLDAIREHKDVPNVMPTIREHKNVPNVMPKRTQHKSTDSHPLDTLMKYIGT